MRVTDKAVVLQAIKYGDQKLILKLYTRNNGLLSVVARVGNSINSKIKTSVVLPFSFITVELILKQNKDIHKLTEANCYWIAADISKSLSKLSIAQFINEILIKVLKEQNSNTHLYDFIETCLKFLEDAEEHFINLHLYFLLELTKYIGIEPHNNYSKAFLFFDCREGQFSSFNSSFPLGFNEEDSFLFSEFLKINSLKTQISNLQRKKILEFLLAYYRIQIPAFNEPKSLEVLKEVMLG